MEAFYDKACLIIGGGGIGCHVAAEVQQRFPNKKIVIADCTKPKINLPNAQFVSLDLSKDCLDSICNLSIDMLFLTAGIGRLSTFETFEEIEIEKNFRVNCVSVIEIISKYYKYLISCQDFYCAVVSSIAGIVASPLYSIYSATKGALVKFIEAVNAELQYKGSKNKIVNIAPGYIGGTGFHGKNCTKEEEENLNILAKQFLDATIAREDLCIPDFEKTYKKVISNYQKNPSKFALESLQYKLEKSTLNNKPQIKTGYLTGTFDLFHIGHLNLLKNAKRYCDRLVVGIHPDGHHKNKEVFVPLDERIEIVKSIKYVDDVIICTDEDIDAYPLLKFNYLFVGSDYKGTERFARYEKYLADKNAQVVYLPYTKKTSSTYLRKIISDKLMEREEK